MTYVATLFAAGLLSTVPADGICTTIPDSSGQRVTCCVDANGQQCCSGQVENGVPVGCVCAAQN